MVEQIKVARKVSGIFNICQNKQNKMNQEDLVKRIIRRYIMSNNDRLRDFAQEIQHNLYSGRIDYDTAEQRIYEFNNEGSQRKVNYDFKIN